MRNKILKIFKDTLKVQLVSDNNKVKDAKIIGELTAAAQIEKLLQAEILLHQAGSNLKHAKKFRREIRRHFFSFLDEIIDNSRWQDRWYFAWKMIRGSKVK